MKRLIIGGQGLVAVLAFVGPAQAVADKYAITLEEHAACDPDATRLCFDAYPDEDKLLSCMKARRNQLTPVCLATLKAGLKKRHLPM